MIQIGQTPFQNIVQEIQLHENQKQILTALQENSTVFYYYSLRELLFEIKLRENIIHAAKLMNDSGATFTSFSHSKFNPKYWVKGSQGYVLKPNVLPSKAIDDIFYNGDMYGFECSTAIVLIYYKAVLDSIDVAAFNRLFRNLLVWNWNYDIDLIIITQRGTEFIPGDVVYFANPDYELPIWLGENAVFLGEGQYFGHGIGIGSSEDMINALNSLRKEGATKSAFMLNQHSRLNFRRLARYARN